MEKSDELKLLKAMHLHVQAEISRNDVKLFDYRGYQRFLESLVNLKEYDAFKSQKGLSENIVVPDQLIPSDEKFRSKPTAYMGLMEPPGFVPFTRLRLPQPSYENMDYSPHQIAYRTYFSSWYFSTSITSRFSSPMINLGAQNLSKYFKNPSELIDLIKDLEVSNLTLIQNCQDAEEIIESFRKKEKALKDESANEVENLMEKMKQMKERILKRDDEYIEEFNGDLNSETVLSEEEEFKKLCEKIASVFEQCSIKKEIKEDVPSNKQLNTAVAQFAQIEAHLADLLTSVSSYPPDRVAALFASVRTARRNEFRRQQREAERIRQEERNRRILERAQAPPPDVAASRHVAAKIEANLKEKSSK
ncbi:hypothetical protein Aperf_G00000005300 [Anoplocephala perfoliata]